MKTTKPYVFGLRMSEHEAELLLQMADEDYRKRGQFVRLLIRREAKARGLLRDKADQRARAA